MVNISANFDEDAPNGLVSIVFTWPKCDVRIDWHTDRQNHRRITSLTPQRVQKMGKALSWKRKDKNDFCP